VKKEIHGGLTNEKYPLKWGFGSIVRTLFG